MYIVAEKLLSPGNLMVPADFFCFLFLHLQAASLATISSMQMIVLLAAGGRIRSHSQHTTHSFLSLASESGFHVFCSIAKNPQTMQMFLLLLCMGFMQLLIIENVVVCEGAPPPICVSLFWIINVNNKPYIASCVHSIKTVRLIQLSIELHANPSICLPQTLHALPKNNQLRSLHYFGSTTGAHKVIVKCHLGYFCT